MKFKPGDVCVIIRDSKEAPHGKPIGTIVVVERFLLKVPWNYRCAVGMRSQRLFHTRELFKIGVL